MNKLAEKLLQAWAEYFSYNDEQLSFKINIGSGSGNREWEGHLAGPKLKTILEYDSEGSFAAIYAKSTIWDYLKDHHMVLLDMVSDDEAYKEHKDIYTLFNSPEVIKLEKGIAAMLDTVVYNWMGYPKSIEGSEGYKPLNIVDTVDIVTQSLKKLNTSIYAKGGRIGESIPVSNKFYKFDSIGEAVITFDSMADGLYFAYTNMGMSEDGFFGFWVKSNGNLFSIDEMIREEYFGQHHNFRNGRHLEAKADNLFPYAIFEYGEYDYKGYARSYKIDENVVNLSDIPVQYANGLALATLLIVNRYKETYIDGEEVYVDSLMPQNQPLLLSADTMSLIKPDSNNMSIINRHKDIEFNTNVEDILSGNVEHMVAGKDLEVVQIYGEGFQPDFEAAIYHPNLKALPSSEDDSDYRVHNEFVGNESQYKSAVYLNIREQLRSYIESKMYKEFESLGGWDYYLNWLHNAITVNLEYILDTVCVETYLDMSSGRHGYGYRPGQGFSTTGSIQSTFKITDKYGARIDKYFSYKRNEALYFDHRFKDKGSYEDFENMVDPYSNSKCNVWMGFKPVDGKDIEALFPGSEVPNLVKIWKHDCMRAGNNILWVTDPCTGIPSPFYQSRGSFSDSGKPTHYNFEFVIGMSKRSLHKRVNRYIEQHPERKEELKEALAQRKEYMNRKDD